MKLLDSWAYPEAWRREEALCQGLIDLRAALLRPGPADIIRRQGEALLQLLAREPGGAARDLGLLLAAWRSSPTQTVVLHLCRLLDELRQQFELQARLFPLEDLTETEPAAAFTAAHARS
jgi:hypothetical protein